MDDPFRRPAFAPSVFYDDPNAALDWLEKAFGFERSMVITDDSGNLAHAEMKFRGGVIYVGSPFAEFVASPKSLQGRTTGIIHVQLDGDVDGHCGRAKAAGAEIMMEPEDQFYGDRTYRARDPEGHIWVFGAVVKTVSREEAEQASGFKIEGWA